LQLPDSVGLVDAKLRDINGSRAADSYGELRNRDVKDRFDLLSFGEIVIPFCFFFQGRLLTQCGICDLCAAVFNYFSPNLFGFETAKDCDKSIAAVLTDVVMPNMRGTELAARLANLLPEIKVIFMSGYLEHND
jgi:CheY-like chemotaxis protein